MSKEKRKLNYFDCVRYHKEHANKTRVATLAFGIGLVVNPVVGIAFVPEIIRQRMLTYKYHKRAEEIMPKKFRHDQ